MTDRQKPPSSPDVPTLRPARRDDRDADVPAAPGLPDVDIGALDELFELREHLLPEDVVAEDAAPPRRSAPVALGRPPEEPPRRLPTIGRFGPYDIVGRLALGGMAEILLAREEAEGAGSRYLVVKRILPEYERDPSFVEMFLDEARVMMRLKHPNVCHVYKFGSEDGNHFIAMEWVNGASLGKVIRRARKAGGLPLPIACKVVALIAQALDHAHAAKDEDGRPLGIVHRDVTPDNLMISYDGSVKLLDFGIAKADARAHKTQAGVVKGKFAYMAPEQCRAKELDHRVDVFALGVCLYEALTGKPLYRRETEYETMEAIVRGPVPTLRERLPDAPPELEAIIARCLAKSPEERFATAGELEEALERFLGARGEVVSGRRITELMNKLFKEEMKRGPALDTTPFGSSYHLDVSEPEARGFTEPAAPDLGALPLPDLELAPLAGTVIPDDIRQGAARPAWTAPSADRRLPTAPPRVRAAVEREGGGGLTKWIVIASAIALLGAGAYFGRSYLVPADDDEAVGPAPVLTGTLTVRSEPPGATLFVDDREVGTTPARVPDLATGSHRVRLVLAGHREHEGALEIRANETNAVSQTLAPLEAEGPVAHGRMTLTSRPPAEVFLRGQSLGRTPLSDIELPAGVVPLELETADGRRHRRAVMVRADDSTATHLDLTD